MWISRQNHTVQQHTLKTHVSLWGTLRVGHPDFSDASVRSKKKKQDGNPKPSFRLTSCAQQRAIRRASPFVGLPQKHGRYHSIMRQSVNHVLSNSDRPLYATTRTEATPSARSSSVAYGSALREIDLLRGRVWCRENTRLLNTPPPMS